MELGFGSMLTLPRIPFPWIDKRLTPGWACCSGHSDSRLLKVARTITEGSFFEATVILKHSSNLCCPGRPEICKMRHRSYPWATDFGLILQGCPLGQTRAFRNPLISEYMTSIDILRKDLQRASVVIVFHNEVRSFRNSLSSLC